MVQQSQDKWQTPAESGVDNNPQPGSATNSAPSVAEWMQDVLGQAPLSPNTAQHTPAPAQPSPDLQSRLAAIARNIETLESRVTGAPAAPAAVAPQPVIAPEMPAPVAHAPEPASDPLDALRRRKRQLEQGIQDVVQPAPAPANAEMVAPAVQVSAPIHVQTEPVAQAPARLAQEAPVSPTPEPESDVGLERLTAKLDEQFSRLTQAVGDVRSIAQASATDQASLRETVAELQTRIDQPTGDHGAGPSPDVSGLSDQIRAVQDAIGAMPKPEAIQSLEDGYHHVLARLDGLKGDGTSEDKIDALYGEVTSLREVLDGLGEGNTASMLTEMRGMIAKLESDPHGSADRITEALESVKSMAHNAVEGQNPSIVNDAIGAVVERLVALEARIEALASGADDSQVTQRLDAIQAEMAQLSNFQDEARGLTSALDTIREEMRTSVPSFDFSSMDQRFSALDRIEEMTGGYAAQVGALSERLHAMDGSLTNQGEMAREVAALSRQMDSLKNTLPVHEIEQTLLDLTGRVTSIQEDTSAERLGLAVRELGERVESCLKSIPKTETIIQAVEDKLDHRMAGAFNPVLSRLDSVDERLDGLQKAISADDAPLIEKMSHRLESLIAAMPTPQADDALASLEQQLADLNKRQSEAGIVSRDDVMRLNNELARARASVELGSNRDLQRAIVDQVRHLANHFDTARSSGDASMLPQIEQQIESLAGRVQSLGLFDASETDAPSMQGVDALHNELASLRATSSDQDQRMHSTLESVQTALETVIRRINALESDDKAAAKLANDTAASTAALSQSSLSSLDDVRRALVANTAPSEPMPTSTFPPPAGPESDADALDLSGSEFASLPKTSTEISPQAQDALPNSPVSSPEDALQTSPEAGDAQTLLRQLSGAMDTAPSPRVTRRSQARKKASEANNQPVVDAANQRANFIAAARRAAQAAALQAGGGSPAAPAMRGAPTQAMPTPAMPDNGQSGQAFGNPTGQMSDSETGRIEPQIDGQADNAENNSKTAGADASAMQPLDALQEPEVQSSPIDQLGQVAKTAHQEQTQKKKKEEKRQATLSRAMLVAIVLFTVGLGLFVANLLLPDDRAPSTVIAPLTSVPPAADEGAELDQEAATDPAEDQGDVRVIGEGEVTPSAIADEPLASVDTPEVQGMAAGSVDGLETASDAPNDLLEASTESALGAGFERDRGPVMAETPQSVDPSALPPPANDLGPLLNPAVPALPAATADSLPEAIGSPRLRVAAAGGDAAAEFEVATRFMEGRFVPQDLETAAHWYGRAASQGIVPAAYRLGSFYEQGRGVDRDRDGAIAWYERAALGGNPRAMHNLAVMAAEGANGASPDFARAAGWFIPASNRGLADSQFNLAVLFARGMGVERDLMESYKWFALAANAGDSEAVSRRDEVAGVLGEQALALARARVDNWTPVPVETSAIIVAGPEGGWDDSPITANGPSAAPSQTQVAEAQSLLSARGYDPGPADGLIGPRTTDAVRAFRQSAGLSDGTAIDQTLLDALRSGASL
ncbi:MAG: peptidoglycan-binding protein [Devosiaceae bacterium]